MPTLWPFRPRAEVIEALEWATDIVPSYEAEERYSLREVPLRSFSFGHVADRAMVNEAREIIRAGDGVLLVPEWPRQVIADASTGAPVALADGPALIWRGVDDVEVVEIVGGLFSAVAQPSLGVRVCPLLACRGYEVGIDRPAGKWAQLTLTAQTADGPDETDPTRYPVYLGESLVTDCPRVGADTTDESVRWEVEALDNGITLPADYRPSGVPDQRFALRWYVSGAEYSSVRAWLYSRRGRWLPFWLPSWGADLLRPERSGSVLFSDTYTEGEGHLVAVIGGIYYPRAIESATLDSSGRWQLALDAALPAGAITRAMYLRRVRLAADRVEVRHAAGQRKAIAVNCVGVPE